MDRLWFQGRWLMWYGDRDPSAIHTKTVTPCKDIVFSGSSAMTIGLGVFNETNSVRVSEP